MVSPLIRCRFARALRCEYSPGRHTWTRISSDRIVLRIAAVATFAAFGGRDSGVPMLLGAAAFAALESDRYHHTLPDCWQVMFSGDATLGLNRPLPRCPAFFLAVVWPRGEVQRVSQALQFAII